MDYLNETEDYENFREQVALEAEDRRNKLLNDEEYAFDENYDWRANPFVNIDFVYGSWMKDNVGCSEYGMYTYILDIKYDEEFVYIKHLWSETKNNSKGGNSKETKFYRNGMKITSLQDYTNGMHWKMMGQSLEYYSKKWLIGSKSRKIFKEVYSRYKARALRNPSIKALNNSKHGLV